MPIKEVPKFISNLIAHTKANFQEFTFFIAKNNRRKYLSRESRIADS
jgi:hypothetical protein